MKKIIVAASGKRMGKTLLITHLIEQFKKNRKSVAAIKVKRMNKGGIDIVRAPGREDSDTYRYKQAGARSVVYVKFSKEEELTDFLDSEVSGLTNITIWESNSICSLLTLNILVYLTDRSEGAKNPELERMADIVCDAPLSVEDAERTAGTIAGLLGSGTFTLGGKYWISKEDHPLFGEGIFNLLRTIEETGSIHSASQKTGIPYKRAWTLIDTTEQKLGAKLLISTRGGVSGGGSTLTPLACRLLDAFEIAAGLFRKFKHGLEI